VKTLSIPFYHPDREKKTTKNGCQAHEYQAHKFSNFFFMVAVGKILAPKDPMPSCCCSSTLKYHNSNVKKKKTTIPLWEVLFAFFPFQFLICNSKSANNKTATKDSRTKCKQIGHG
jgi:hypothetical protein